MPRIQLKPNSPEFADESRPQAKFKTCDMAGCLHEGEFRAPKDRSLNEYYRLCEDHVREYNKAWNYFADMDDEEIAKHMKDNIYGHRPTWKYGVGAEQIDEMYRKAWQSYHYTDEEPPKGHERYRKTSEDFIEERTPEQDALVIMDMQPPVTLAGIKKRYKELAKQYHPDMNAGDKNAEEKLKHINMAYTILKVAYEKYEKLEKSKSF
jgi:DnaJ-domain-containing protein 1